MLHLNPCSPCSSLWSRGSASPQWAKLTAVCLWEPSSTQTRSFLKYSYVLFCYFYFYFIHYLCLFGTESLYVWRCKLSVSLHIQRAKFEIKIVQGKASLQYQLLFCPTHPTPSVWKPFERYFGALLTFWRTWFFGLERLLSNNFADWHPALNNLNKKRSGCHLLFPKTFCSSGAVGGDCV